MWIYNVRTYVHVCACFKTGKIINSSRVNFIEFVWKNNCRNKLKYEEVIYKTKQ